MRLWSVVVTHLTKAFPFRVGRTSCVGRVSAGRSAKVVMLRSPSEFLGSSGIQMELQL